MPSREGGSRSVAKLARALGVEANAASVCEAVYPTLARVGGPAALNDAIASVRQGATIRAFWERWETTRTTETLPDSIEDRLRIFSTREKLRIAVRELLAVGTDVDATARELSLVAEVCVEIALTNALEWATDRFGKPRTLSGEDSAFVVMGMGKLGGEELNAGSDIDLVYVYDSDEAEIIAADGAVRDMTVHEYFARVAERLTRTLDELNEHGQTWRVDLRLRPEGRTGPLVNSLPALEGYYETWGRTWERAAWLRARAVAGDRGLGLDIERALAPFIFRRAVEPKVAFELASLVDKARRERGRVASLRDLKICVGGIRDLEFFVQSLQLIWAGRDASLRVRPTHKALARLVKGGYVTAEEARRLSSAYLLFRRVEHRVQFVTMQQTHVLPTGDTGRLIAASLGYPPTDALAALERELADAQRITKDRFDTLLPGATVERAPEEDVLDAIEAESENDSQREATVREALRAIAIAEVDRYPDLTAHILRLGRRPDDPLGAMTRADSPAFAATFVRAVLEAADPDLAARKATTFFSHSVVTQMYVKTFAENPRGLRRLLALFGASNMLGDSLLGHRELVDSVLFPTAPPDEFIATRAIEEELAQIAPDQEGDPESFAGALRRAKQRILLAVGIADLGNELGLVAVMRTLSALAEESLARCLAWVTNAVAPDALLGIIAMGKLGGRELGYGSDLDLMFVYEGDDEAGVACSRIATRVMRLLSAPHGDGPGYELDARLRPSGNQGLLVVSRESFARYHGTNVESVGVRAQCWERQALVKARDVAGDATVRAACMAVATESAFGRGAPDPREFWSLRTRMERELGQESRAGHARRFHVKAGHGGLVDVEFGVQWLQMHHGSDVRVRTPETLSAIDALERAGYVKPADADRLREAYAFLRRVELTLRMVHGARSEWIQEGAAGLEEISRRLGFHAHGGRSAAETFIERYEELTVETRRTFERLVPVPA